jgi:hypothetical protein
MWRKKRQQQKLLNELRWCNLTRKWMPDGFSSSFFGFQLIYKSQADRLDSTQQDKSEWPGVFCLAHLSQYPQTR